MNDFPSLRLMSFGEIQVFSLKVYSHELSFISAVQCGGFCFGKVNFDLKSHFITTYSHDGFAVEAAFQEAREMTNKTEE